MKFEWDPEKNKANIIKHGIDFSVLEQFNWDGAIILPDTRYAYGEERFIAYADLHNRFYGVVFTRRGDVIRIIGARKANSREKKAYDKNAKKT